MDLEQIRKLLEIFDESSTTLMEIEEGNLRIHLEKESFDADDCLSLFYGEDSDDEQEEMEEDSADLREQTAEEMAVDAENTL